ncbi:MAG: YdcF family protein, partial [Hyphomicrobiales bacterium]
EDDVTILMREIGFAPPDRMVVKYRMLERLGISRDMVAEFGNGSMNTREEAEALARFLDGGREAVIIVTTNYHSNRAKMIFEAALPDAKVMVACPGGCVAPANWWTDPAVTAQFVLEMVKFGYYLIGNTDGV